MATTDTKDPFDAVLEEHEENLGNATPDPLHQSWHSFRVARAAAGESHVNTLDLAEHFELST